MPFLIDPLHDSSHEMLHQLSMSALRGNTRLRIRCQASRFGRWIQVQNEDDHIAVRLAVPKWRKCRLLHYQACSVVVEGEICTKMR
jgi:hypothetical protein